MIIKEYIEDGNRIRHYSDSGMRILQNETGVIYDDAVDVVPCKYTYSETDKPIENTVPQEEDTKSYKEGAYGTK